MVELLRRIYKGKLIKPRAATIFSTDGPVPDRQEPDEGAASGGTPVEHKTGTLMGCTGDVGFITMPDGRRIAVAIFARGGANRPRTIAEAARAIYDGFKSVFSWPLPAVTAH